MTDISLAQRVYATVATYPSWTSGQVAEHLGTTDSYVRVVLQRATASDYFSRHKFRVGDMVYVDGYKKGQVQTIRWENGAVWYFIRNSSTKRGEGWVATRMEKDLTAVK